MYSYWLPGNLYTQQIQLSKNTLIHFYIVQLDEDMEIVGFESGWRRINKENSKLIHFYIVQLDESMETVGCWIWTTKDRQREFKAYPLS